MKRLSNTKLNIAWGGIGEVVVPGEGGHLSHDPAGNDGGEAWDDDASLLMGSCLASEIPRIEGWGSGDLTLSFPFKTV
jgi:hypothetical protein